MTMSKSGMGLTFVVVLAALQLAGLGQTNLLDNSAYDWKSAPSRLGAVAIEEIRYKAALAVINDRRREIDAQWQKDSQNCNNKPSQREVEGCKRAAEQKMYADRAQTDDAETNAKKLHTKKLDDIGRYWDRQANDPGRTNRIDGRDGQTFVDKVPKPVKEYVYPTKLLRGDWFVQLPDRRWVPAVLQSTGRLVPRDRTLRVN